MNFRPTNGTYVNGNAAKPEVLRFCNDRFADNEQNRQRCIAAGLTYQDHGSNSYEWGAQEAAGVYDAGKGVIERVGKASDDLLNMLEQFGKYFPYILAIIAIIVLTNLFKK